MIVACLTTWEPRVAMIGPTLETVCAQRSVERVLLLVAPQVRVDAVRVAFDTRAEVFVVEDIGPGKKHLASNFCAPDDTIITFDDDYLYASDHAETLARNVAECGCVCGFQGHSIDGATVEDADADYLGGLLSWGYRARWLKPSNVLRWGRDQRTREADDVYLGAIFRRAGLRCRVVPGEYRHRRPHANIEAYLTAALRFHPDCYARERSCIVAAWSGLAEVAA